MNFSIHVPLSSLSTDLILETNIPFDYIFKKVSTDSRKNIDNSNFICLKSKKFDSHALIKNLVETKKIKCLILHDASYIPLIKQANLLYLYVTDTTKLLQVFAKKHRILLNPFVIAITGSNGKTTTKDLIAHLLTSFWPSTEIIKTNKNFNNHFGVAYSLLNIKKEHKIAIIELGTNHPNEISKLASLALPNIGILTSISQSHIGNFLNIHDIIKEKCSMLLYLSKNGYFIISETSDHQKEIKKHLSQNPIPKIITSYHPSIHSIQQKSLSSNGQTVAYKNQQYNIPIWGKTQFYNLCLSLQVIHTTLSMKKSIFVEKGTNWIPPTLNKLSSFQHPDNRLSLYSYKPHWIWNDTYNANLASFYSSIEVLLEYKNSILPTKSWSGLFGGMEELGKYTYAHHKALATYSSLNKIRFLIFIYTNEEQVNGIQKGLHPNIPLLLIEYNDKNINEKIISFLGEHLKQKNHILVKGSRKNQLERFLEIIN